ncbi:MAG: universal stress protein [Usitatibacter sp.]
MYERILVPVDGSPTAERGLEEAIRLAKITGATLRVVHVAELMNFVTTLEPAVAYSSDVIAVMTREGEKTLERAKARACASGVAVETLLLDNLSASVSEHVIDQAKAWNAELIVIGTHGRRGIGRIMLGSDAEAIARTSPVPVLLVRLPAPAGEAGQQVAREAVASSQPAQVY